MFENDIDTFGSGKTLNADGDILIYKPCCVFNDDSDHDRTMISRLIRKHINQMTVEAACDYYRIFLTTKKNFRDFLVDDYKANRDNTERPVNLAWAKRWTVDNLESVFHEGLEADDLLAIHQDENTVLWSPDKDLRQIPGQHLDEATRRVITITKMGNLTDRGTKVLFTGMIGFYLQCLTGDGADWIVGCGIREKVLIKSGAKKGQLKNKRLGVGPKVAYKLLMSAAYSCIKAGISEEETLETFKAIVLNEYVKRFGSENAVAKFEEQANLLWMVREQNGDIIKRWTVDNRDEYFDVANGVVS